MWLDPDGQPYAWSFTCGHHGHVFVAAEVPPSAATMRAIHDRGCGRPCANGGPAQPRRYDG